MIHVKIKYLRISVNNLIRMRYDGFLNAVYGNFSSIPEAVPVSIHIVLKVGAFCVTAFRLKYGINAGFVLILFCSPN